MKNNIRSYIFGLMAGIVLAGAITGAGYAFYQRWPIIKEAIRSNSYKKLLIPKKKTVEKNLKTPQASSSSIIQVTVDLKQELGKISPLLYGSNLAPKMETEPDIINFAKLIGITCLRYPGGTQGYHWKSGIFDFAERFSTVPLRNIDYLIRFCQKTNTKLIWQVNVESGTAQEAAELVEYMNKKSGFPIVYWELGNEVYGDWDKGYMPAGKYAQLIKDYAQAMKAVDPAIKIGADWAQRDANFNKTIIKDAGEYIDFISVHWYPNHINASHVFEGRIHPTPQEVMGNSMQIPLIVKDAQEIIAKYSPARKGKIEVGFLEWDGSWDAPNSDFSPYSRDIAQWSLANAIFYADCLGQFAEQGITVSTHYDFQSINFGLIRGWDKAAGWGGSRWDGEIIRPKAFAIQLFSKHFGDVLLKTTIENAPFYVKEKDWWALSYNGRVPYVSCYSSKVTKENKLSLVLINKHEQDTFKLKVNLRNVKCKEEGELLVLTGKTLLAQNDGNPMAAVIKEYKIQNVSNEFSFTLPARSVCLLKIGMEN